MILKYKCVDGHSTVVKAPENTVHPLIMDCQECRQLSSLQPECPQDIEPTHEWYIPVKRKGLTKEDNRRYRKGGLYLKQINNQ